MEMVRSFLPVGQGAFYTEQFADGTNVIYDCGSENGIRMIKEMIKSIFHEGDIIHAVFISHMHSDHMNGLEFLLKYCNVRAIYLPFLTKKEINMATLVQEVTHGTTQFAREFIQNPENTVRRYLGDPNKDTPKVKYVLPQDTSDSLPEDRERTIRQQIPSGKRIPKPSTSEAASWVYIPFNLKNNERTQLFIEQLKKLKVDIDDWEHVQTVISTKDGRAKIRKAYETIPGGLNTNSLVVYSGPDSGVNNWDSFQIYAHPNRKWQYSHLIPAGCLYLGDFDAHTVANHIQLEESYTECWRKVGVLQIPHHGSKHNFNSRLLSKAHWFVISAGSENRYKHPHASVLKEIIAHRKPCVWVTEKIDSIGQFLVQRI